MRDLDDIPERLRPQVQAHLETIRAGLESVQLDPNRQPWFPLNFGGIVPLIASDAHEPG